MPRAARSTVLSAFLVALTLTTAAAQTAGPTDVWWTVHRVHRFQFYAFPADTVAWPHARFAGFDLNEAATHETATVAGPVSMRTDVVAGAGVLTADFSTSAHNDAQYGLYHLLTNTLEVKAYVRGAPGTPCLVERVRRGTGLASRMGGLPGGLQPVNGTARATFADSSAYVPDGGVDSTALADSVVIPLNTNADTIRVNGELYSAVYSLVLPAGTHLTQAVCILGCMRAPASFVSDVAGTLKIEITPGVNPVGAPLAPGRDTDLRVSAAPNPVRGSSAVTFAARAGEPVSVAVFDLGGRRVAQLWEGSATGAAQRVDWRPGRGEAGVYLIRAEAGRRTVATKVAVVR